MHLLFLISIILTVISTAFLTIISENKKIYQAGCIFGGILFGQVVLTYELLSLFSAVTPVNVLIINAVFFVISLLLLKKSGKKPEYKEDFDDEKRRIKFAVQKDKWLKIAVISFFIYMAGSLIYMYVVPPNDGDAVSYHIARIPFWYEAHNINHFVCSDIRALVMPINSEVFYFWAYSFIKSDIFVRVFSFLSYLLFAVGLRGLFKEIKISAGVFLWTLLSLTAMQNIMFAVTGTETNIAIAGLVISSLFLFLTGLKKSEIKYIYFSSLMYALAAGTKTPALQAIPAVAVIMLTIAVLEKKKEAFKYLLMFAGFFLLNFIIFASYNYVLNFIDFGNPVSSVNVTETHKLYGGFKAFVANIIRYCGMMIDTTGLPYCVPFWRIKTAIVDCVLALLGIQPDIGLIAPDSKHFDIGNNYENLCGLGILGIIVFLPALFISLKRIKHSEKSLFFGVFAAGFLINIVVLSATLGYMLYSIRFIMFFVMIAAPVITYIFVINRKNLFKKIIALIIIYSFTFSYYFYERRFSPYLCYVFYKNKTVNNFKTNARCANIDFDIPSQACVIYNDIKNDGHNVLYFATSGSDLFFLKNMSNLNNNFHIDYKLLETTNEDDIDWDKYDYILVPLKQDNTTIKEITKYKNAVINYNDGSDGSAPYYDFAPDLFANCVFASSRIKNFKWLSEDENKITTSECFYKPYILEKHNYSLFVETNKDKETQVNIYKKNRN